MKLPTRHADSPCTREIEERVFFCLVAVGVRRFSAEPETRRPAVTLMAANALRLAIRFLGKKAAAELALEVLRERSL